jgi:dihydroorotase
MSYPIFDLHWHGRDEEEAAKDTLERSLAVAEASGLIGLVWMPNPKRGLITLERCREYLALGDRAKSKVRSYVNAGITPDLEQVKRIIDAWRIEPRIIGLKEYLELSTNELSVLKSDQKRATIATMASEGYTGVLIIHSGCQDDNSDNQYDPKNPKTWSTMCRPEVSEAHGFDEFIGFAEEANFKGTIHVAHVSTTYVVDRILSYKGPLRLSCGVTPHHAFLSNEYLARPDGVLFKCNPPLRDEETRKGLEDRLVDGRIKIIESDHAPHTLADKQGTKPASGLPIGLAWPETLGAMIRRGMLPAQIRAAVCDNAVNLFGGKLKDLEIPDSAYVDMEKLAKLRAAYPYDVSMYIK